MDSANICQIQRLIENSPTNLVLGVIRGRYSFLTDLADLNLSGVISVLFLNSAIRDTVPPKTLTLFDVVIWFDGGEFWAGQNLAHLDSLDFPDLNSNIDELCRLVDSNRIRLVAMEEQFVRFVARARKVHSIPGPKPDDVERFSDKMKMKSVATKSNIPTSRYKVVQTKDIRNDENKLKSLESALTYPMFMKPVHGCGSAGTAKIQDRKSFLEWLDIKRDENSAFLAEEYVDGREIAIVGFCQNGKVEFFPSTLCIHAHLTKHQFLDTGKPLSFYSRGDKCENEKIFQFGQQVANAFQAIDGSLLFVQFFHTANGFLLNELACRPPGAIGSVVITQNTGISTEAIHIMGQIKSISLTDFMKPMKPFGMIVYAKREMKDCKLLDIPKNKLSSKVEGKWNVKSGENLNKATNISDVIVRIHLWNSDYGSLLKDLDYLRDNYDPLKGKIIS